MMAVAQRVTEAAVAVAGQVVGRIGPGMVALVAIHRDDRPDDVRWMANKLMSLRIFRNGEKHFDADIRESGGAMLLISNFTVAGQTRKGRRPSFDAAAGPELGRRLFDELVAAVAALGVPTATGQFGANMQVTLTNDGPATFIIDSGPSQVV